jgi:hypothetical protein
MRHKLSTIVFAQGWMGGQLESNLAKAAEKKDEDPTAHLIAAQMVEQWNLLDAALDDFVKEYQDMSNRLAQVKAALL